jgi:DNA-binding XRE family transcriptional regulator
VLASVGGCGAGAVRPLGSISQNVPVSGQSAGATRAKPRASATICTTESWPAGGAASASWGNNIMLPAMKSSLTVFMFDSPRFPPNRFCLSSAQLRCRTFQKTRQSKKVYPSGYGANTHVLIAFSVSEIGKIRKKIGANIRACREKSDLTQEKLAEKADLHPVYVSLVENGHKAVSVEALWRISKALRVPAARFFRDV